jgi:hypothetical protein
MFDQDSGDEEDWVEVVAFDGSREDLEAFEDVKSEN